MSDRQCRAAADVESLIGKIQYEEVGEFPVERGYIWTTCASVENGNPLYWDDDVAEEITGGPIAPPTMLSVWFRRHRWAPGREGETLAIQSHFDLKERLGLPEAVISDNTIVFHEPVRVGDVLAHQVLRSVSEEKTTKLGVGPLLGDRRRVLQPARRPRRHGDLHRLRVPAGRVMTTRSPCSARRSTT